ncbi:hypothetical protein [Salibacterium halotolerans]|uniref:Uncharacterized protein n=1 Tax=Salibacterium halotolerans TaxID=1884432 RepID=A0A1I5MQ33_9BACI|nr:hypothetical protein [Salibacterium halotolerans]SFP11669.1 hypothetical protein SAMN05518683_102304 [Salibacterium halotolerans]
MEVTLSRWIILKDIAHKSRNVTKTFTSEVIPHKGDFVFSTAFERDEEVEVASVFIDYERDDCMVFLEPLSLNTEDNHYLKQTVDMYMLHEWKCTFYDFE